MASFPQGYLLSQSKYVTDIFQRPRLTDSRMVKTPLELNVHYSSTEGACLSNPALYQVLVGSFVYLIVHGMILLMMSIL